MAKAKKTTTNNTTRFLEIGHTYEASIELNGHSVEVGVKLMGTATVRSWIARYQLLAIKETKARISKAQELGVTLAEFEAQASAWQSPDFIEEASLLSSDIIEETLTYINAIVGGVDLNVETDRTVEMLDKAGLLQQVSAQLLQLQTPNNRQALSSAPSPQ